MIVSARIYVIVISPTIHISCHILVLIGHSWSLMVMITSDLIARGEAALKRPPPRSGDDHALKLRFLTHVLRRPISTHRRNHMTWAQIAFAVCAEFNLPCEDPKKVGRCMSQYHREPLSRIAAGLQGQTSPEKPHVRSSQPNTDRKTRQPEASKTDDFRIMDPADLLRARKEIDFDD